jgi:phenylacetate-CoA ligase
MALINIISEKLVLPISDLLLGQTVSRNLHFLRLSEFWSREQIDAYQNKKLRHLIDHAYRTVPYYNELFKSILLKPSDIKSKQDLHKIPILSKEIIKKSGIDYFTSAAYKNKKVLKKSSSGSTGEPLTYLINKEAYSFNIAANLRGWMSMGFRIGDKFMKLSSGERKNKLKKIQDAVSRNRYTYLSPLSDEHLLSILQQIEDYQPKIIRCYSDPLILLAKLKLKYPRFSYSPKAINTTGNILQPEQRKQIENAFQCKVYDSYSSEGNSCVFECVSHNHYHSAEEYGITEIIDHFGKSITTGTGRLISTDLHNLAHPFIRYDTQDLVELGDQKTCCKNQHLVIKRILGRDNEMLLLNNGRRFVVHDFTIFFSQKELNNSIDQFQIVNQGENVLIHLIINSNYEAKMDEFIKKYWTERFGKKVIMNIVTSIDLTKNGKRRFIISE